MNQVRPLKTHILTANPNMSTAELSAVGESGFSLAICFGQQIILLLFVAPHTIDKISVRDLFVAFSRDIFYKYYLSEKAVARGTDPYCLYIRVSLITAGYLRIPQDTTGYRRIPSNGRFNGI